MAVEGLEGVQVTTYAFQNGLPIPAQVLTFVPDDLSRVLCIYDDPRLGLLQ